MFYFAKKVSIWNKITQQWDIQGHGIYRYKIARILKLSKSTNSCKSVIQS